MGTDRRACDAGGGACRGRRGRGRVRRSARQEPGVVRVSEIERIEADAVGVARFEADAVDVAPSEPTTAAEGEANSPSAPIELTEAALEALLFVAERPLARREIASLAGTDRATVDARLGDLEVSLRSRGVRLLTDGDRVELATAPDAGALVARYVGAD